jgi:hypothetical protein
MLRARSLRRIRPLGPLLGAALAVMLLPAVHVLLGVPPTDLELAVASYVPAVFIVLWMMDDARMRHCTPCYDLGFFLLLLFPLSLLWYLVWTRTWWGLVVFAGMLAVVYVPWIIGNVAALLVAG